MNKLSPAKRSTPMTISVGDEHKEALDEIISEDSTFPPTRSEVAAGAILYLRDSIKKGEVTLHQVYKTYFASPVSQVSDMRPGA